MSGQVWSELGATVLLLVGVGATFGLFMLLAVGSIWRGDLWREQQEAEGTPGLAEAFDHDVPANGESQSEVA